ncbi:MAG: PilN domain-containing protein [Candidatus Korobacteraceae bacterium]|jgi:type IV pilus assembly protein PilN
MRLNINLASQPYEIAREYKRRMTLLIAGLAVAAVVLLGYILYQRAHSRTINQQLAIVQGQIDGLNREESQARAILNKPANKVIADQSEFLNDLFARKSMSWTHIFTVMEKIVPPELHVVSMKPAFSKTNDLVLQVVVATDSRDRAVELVRNMEKSSHFRQPQVVAENVVANTSEQGQAGGIQFDIAAIYVPVADNEESSDAGTATGEKNPAPQAAPTLAKKAAAAPSRNMAPNGNAAAAPNINNAAQNRPVAPGPMRPH